MACGSSVAAAVYCHAMSADDGIKQERKKHSCCLAGSSIFAAVVSEQLADGISRRSKQWQGLATNNIDKLKTILIIQKRKSIGDDGGATETGSKPQQKNNTAGSTMATAAIMACGWQPAALQQLLLAGSE